MPSLWKVPHAPGAPWACPSPGKAVWAHNQAACDLPLEAAAGADLNNLIWAHQVISFDILINIHDQNVLFSLLFFLVAELPFVPVDRALAIRKLLTQLPGCSQRGLGDVSQPTAGYRARFPVIYTAGRCSQTLCQSRNSTTIQEDLQLQQVQKLFPSGHPEGY